MADWFTVRTLAVRESADDLFELDIDVRGTGAAGSHRRPGQYVQLKLAPHEEAPFALASTPDERGDRFEFLIKRGSPLPDALASLRPGDPLEATAALGAGFPLDRARGHDVLLFATGSGISPVRSLIGALRRERPAYGSVTLYFGARTPSAFAYAHELEQWSGSEIEVVRTVSQPGETGWTGLTGYVQSHIEPGTHAYENAVAFVCGQRPMVEGVTAALTRAGVPKDRVFLNY